MNRRTGDEAKYEAFKRQLWRGSPEAYLYFLAEIAEKAHLKVNKSHSGLLIRKTHRAKSGKLLQISKSHSGLLT